MIVDAKRAMEDRPAWQISFLVLVVSMLALLPAWLHYDIISRDGAFQYIPVARLFLDGNIVGALSRPQLPLYPMLMAALSWITGVDLELSGRLISGLSFILASLGLYKVTELVFKDRWASLLAVLFLISNKELLDRSVDCLKESLLVFLVIWGNYFILRALGTKGRTLLKRLLLGVFLLFLGSMVRMTAMFFVMAWLLMWVFRRKQGLITRTIILSTPVLALLLFMAFRPDASLFTRKGFALPALVSCWQGILPMLESGALVLRKFFATGNYLPVFFGFLGLYYFRRHVYYIHLSLVLVIFLLVLSIMPWISDRYFLAPLVWMYPLSAYALTWSFSHLSRPIRILAILTIVLCPLVWADKALTPPDADRLARKEAGRWILASAGGDNIVVTNRDRLAFYARARFVPLMGSNDIKKSPGRCMAIDTMLADGKAAKSVLDRMGIKPDRKFRTIYVYLPRYSGRAHRLKDIH